MVEFCGLLGPDVLESLRRARSLGVAGAMRRYNEKAVPGIGGVWYGKQLMLALLGVRVAELAREAGSNVKNMECANAIEALACCLAYESNGWQQDPRMRGRLKLPHASDLNDGPLFKQFRKPSFYVTQPMRMAAGSALVPLGFARAANGRFNSLEVSEAGQNFLDSALASYRPANRSVQDHLARWTRNESVNVTTDLMVEALSPQIELSERPLRILRERLISGGSSEPESDRARRRNALTWVESLRSDPIQGTQSWDQRPACIEPAHWSDLQAGARLTAARDAAIRLLDGLEKKVAHASRQRLGISEAVDEETTELLTSLRKAAQGYLDVAKRDAVEAEAQSFCDDCLATELQDALCKVVLRDDRVLRIRNGVLVPGPAFQHGATSDPDASADDMTGEAAEEDAAQSANPANFPEGISPRIHNLRRLNLELNGELHARLSNEETSA